MCTWLRIAPESTLTLWLRNKLPFHHQQPLLSLINPPLQHRKVFSGLQTQGCLISHLSQVTIRYIWLKALILVPKPTPLCQKQAWQKLTEPPKAPLQLTIMTKRPPQLWGPGRSYPPNHGSRKGEMWQMQQWNVDLSQDNAQLQAELEYTGWPTWDTTDPLVTAMVQPVILEEAKQVGCSPSCCLRSPWRIYPLLKEPGTHMERAAMGDSTQVHTSSIWAPATRCPGGTSVRRVLDQLHLWALNNLWRGSSEKQCTGGYCAHFFQWSFREETGWVHR